MDATSLGGAHYYVTLIDDHSRKVWAYALKSKDQALEKFKHFNALVERETGIKWKYVRSDNDGQYRKPFEAFDRIHGIKFKKTEKKMSQYNRVVERKNCTINERIRCMVSHAKLPKPF